MTNVTLSPEDELRYAVNEAIDLAKRAQRDPQRGWRGEVLNPRQQPTLSRLRSPGASRVKSWLHRLTERDTIRYEDQPTTLAHNITHTFGLSIRNLEEDAKQAKGDSALRIEATIEAMRASLKRLEAAKEAIDKQRQRELEQRQERFPRDSKRRDKIDTRALLLRDAYDLADKYQIEHSGRADTTNEKLSILLVDIAAHVDKEVKDDFLVAAGRVREGKYRQPWLTVYNYIEKLEAE